MRRGGAIVSVTQIPISPLADAHRFYKCLHVLAGVFPVAWTLSRRQHVGTDTHTVCCAGRPSGRRGSQLSSACSAKT